LALKNGFDNGMTAALDMERCAIVDGRTNVALIGGELRKRRRHIEARDRRGGRCDFGTVREHFTDEIGEEFELERERILSSSSESATVVKRMALAMLCR
jgi:hypothetical protein